MVTGRDRRLAVECDGDAWHGPEQFAHDQGRQRDLERCGWTFVRLRGSEFFGDRHRTLEPLWEALERYGIHPQGQEPMAVVATEPPSPTPVPAGRLNSNPPQRRSRPHRPPTISRSNSCCQRCRWSPPPESTRRLGAGPAASEVAPVTDGEIREGLPAYSIWHAQQLVPHLGSPALTNERLADLLVEVVRVEGPIVAELAYRRVARASGVLRVTNATRRVLNPALALALRRMRLDSTNPLHGPGYSQRVLQVPGRPYIVVRARGDRDLEDVPPDEVAAVGKAITIRHGLTGEALKRAVLDFYDRSRLTERASSYLSACFRLMDDDAVTAAARSIPEASLQQVSSPPPPPVQTSALGTARSTTHAIPTDEPVASPADEEPEEATPGGPPFWEVVLDVVRRGSSLHEATLDALAALWDQADKGDMDLVRIEAEKVGAERLWSDVARFVTSSSSGLSPSARGALVDIAYTTYLLATPSSESQRADLGPWALRLLDEWTVAQETRSHPRAPQPPNDDRCMHGALRAQCLAPSCKHHALGGFDFTQS